MFFENPQLLWLLVIPALLVAVVAVLLLLLVLMLQPWECFQLRLLLTRGL